MLPNLDAFSVLRTANGEFPWCHLCEHAVKGSFLFHLQRSHSTTDSPELRKLLETRPDLKVIVETQLKPPMPAPWPNGVRPIAGIKVQPGYKCLICGHLRSSKENMSRHIKHLHDIQGDKSIYRQYTPMQTWFPNSNGGNGVWWTVNYEAPYLHEFQQPIFNDSIKAHNIEYRQRMKDFLSLAPRIELEKKKRKKEKDIQSTLPDSIPNGLLFEPQLTSTHLKDDRNAFIEKTGWRRIFKKLPYVEAMRTLTMQPKPKAFQDIQLHDVANENNELLSGVSTAIDEAILRVIVNQFQLNVIKRCRRTFRKTPLIFRVWLRSYWPDKTSLTAFSWLRNDESLNKYTAYWICLLCLIFRALNLHYSNPDLEKKVVDIYQHLDNEVKDQVQQIWSAASTIHSIQDQEDKRVQPLEKEIQERIMALNIGLLKQPLGWNGTASNNLLLQYVGILSFDITFYRKSGGRQRSFVPTSTSTGYIASLVWLARIFCLEYALPLKEYTTLRWPAVESYTDKVARLQEVRRSVLCLGTHTVIGE
jgi:Orsellinic acid/F9775 biosynthesis cluster protein D